MALPRYFWIWLVAASVSVFGDVSLMFGLGWAASRYDGRTGLVLLAAAIPRAALLLVGGAIGVRFGASSPGSELRAMCVATAAAAAVTGASVGGWLVGVAGFPAVALFDSCTLLWVRRFVHPPASATHPSIVRSIAGG